MKLGLDITPDLAELMAEEIKAAEKAVTEGVGAAAERLKGGWRAQINGAGLGPRLARTIRSERYPKQGHSIGAAGLVWSKAPEIIGAHDSGALIRAKTGLWLTIPTPVARERIRRGPLTPAIWRQRTGITLRLVRRRAGPHLLVADNVRFTRSGRIRENVTRRKDGTTYSRLEGRSSAPIFLLVPQVKLPKRLDLGRDVRAVEGALPGLVAGSWEPSS
jgi:hypothetical protein